MGKIRASFLEIYREHLRDLIVPKAGKKDKVHKIMELEQGKFRQQFNSRKTSSSRGRGRQFRPGASRKKVDKKRLRPLGNRD